MLVQDVVSCSFSSWYANFKNATIPSICIPVTKEFVDYLLSDGIVLPGKVPASQSCANDSDDEVDWSEADCESSEIPSFPDLEEKVSRAIERLGGRVFPKLNWSSPKDASWIATNNSLCCTSFSDVCLLLKSSDFVTHDLTQPFKACTDWRKDTDTGHLFKYELVLRKWVEIDPSTEFRCFVKDSVLIGISQRDYTHYYYHIQEQEANIVQDISTFFHECVKSKFVSSKYVFDVYRKRKDTVKLLDINPFGVHTDALLFDWEELDSLEACENPGFPEFRYMKENHGVQPSPYRHYALPRDVVDLCAGEDAQKLIDLMKLKPGEESSEDEDCHQDASS
ncbi:cell division cycle protein 123 homolog isoform X2 [Ixodes scapularis]|uniref:cell division cycle protein 123 homolog isoform X2 n=1 Tax=Ixodes scapularis TaxID=6945 RepID=UPI001A9CEDE6|nr:cell division cycle protein 123 homolog isoform X2 [Ixodes scapularis]